jgi:hypothetical protein
VLLPLKENQQQKQEEVAVRPMPLARPFLTFLTQSDILSGLRGADKWRRVPRAGPQINKGHARALSLRGSFLLIAQRSLLTDCMCMGESAALFDEFLSA